MPEYRRARIAGGTYFFTVVTYGRLPVFRDEGAVSLLRDCIRKVRAGHPFSIEAMVVLPDHLHCIWTMPEGDSDYSGRWRWIKARFSRSYGHALAHRSESMRSKGELAVWQRRFWEHWVRDEDDFKRHCDYIHYNPVKHGLVGSPAEWPYSSFERYVRMGVYAQDWGSSVSAEVLGMDVE
jgi:putative transposase